MSSAPGPIFIRTATTVDAAACVAIYRPLVESTAVSFETIVPSVEEFAARIQNSLSAWTWLISHRGQGVGSQLYRRLFTDLASLGYCNAYAGVTQPNEASMALHRGVGFEYIGTFRSVGRKFDRWHDVAWFQRKLRETPPT